MEVWDHICDQTLERLPTAPYLEELITLAELEMAAHKQGFKSLAEIDRAVLEPGGTISLIGREPRAETVRYEEIMTRLDHIAHVTMLHLGGEVLGFFFAAEAKGREQGHRDEDRGDDKPLILQDVHCMNPFCTSATRGSGTARAGRRCPRSS